MPVHRGSTFEQEGRGSGDAGTCGRLREQRQGGIAAGTCWEQASFVAKDRIEGAY